MKNVCVLMTSYNGDKYIIDQIDSILNQRGVNVTLYVSDDLSTDQTPNILDAYCVSNRINLLGNNNKHGTAGKNFFSMISQVEFDGFDFVAFADQDDIWDIDKILKSVDYIEANEGCVAVSSCVEAFWPNGRTLFVNKALPQKRYDYMFEAAGPGCTYLVTSAFARELKELLRKRPGIYTGVFHHDWLIYAYARAMGYGWHIFPFSTLKYRQHESNEIGVNSGLSAFRKRLLKLKSGWYLDQVYAVANAVGYEDSLRNYFTTRGRPNGRFFLNFREMRRSFGAALVFSFLLLLGIVR